MGRFPMTCSRSSCTSRASGTVLARTVLAPAAEGLGPRLEPAQRGVDDDLLRPALEYARHGDLHVHRQLVADLGAPARAGRHPVAAGHLGDDRTWLGQLPAHRVVTVPAVGQHVGIADQPGVEGEPHQASPAVRPVLDDLGRLQRGGPFRVPGKVRDHAHDAGRGRRHPDARRGPAAHPRSVPPSRHYSMRAAGRTGEKTVTRPGTPATASRPPLGYESSPDLGRASPAPDLFRSVSRGPVSNPRRGTVLPHFTTGLPGITLLKTTTGTARRRGRRYQLVARPAVTVTTACLALGAALAPASAAAAAPAARAAQVTDPAALVNPFIGTSNLGDTFPGADAPFGMVQWSPDTPSKPRGGGYSYGDSSITGFSLTHLSGPGCYGEGDVPVLPTTGKVVDTATDGFSHSNESAQAGEYQVSLSNGITTALTATTRTGMAQFTFPATTQANLLFKLDGSQNGDSATHFTVISSTEVQGSVTSGGFCQTGVKYTLYFDMQFSQPFTTTGTWTGSVLKHGARNLSIASHSTRTPVSVSPTVPEKPGHPVYHGPLPAGQQKVTKALTGPAGAYLTFNTSSNQTVLAKVGISYVSVGNALNNLSVENPGWSFSSTQAATQTAWNALLGKVAITAGTAAQQTEFYTALYHAMLAPNVFSDDNGQYRGVTGAVHTVDSGHSAFYTNSSGWDIYRTQAQLEALLDPQVASDTAQSMVDDYAQNGMLPKWMNNNQETYVMVGDPADPILADYYAFGARDFNAAGALRDMVGEASNANKIRPAESYLNAPGYLPWGAKYGCCNAYGPSATTLEYDTADFAISALAGDLNDPGWQQTFANRAQDWRNVLNPDSGFDQPRNSNGEWTTNFSPTSSVSFVEADPWIYTGMVPFDLAGLAAAKGGDTQMAAYLNTTLRSFTGADGYAWVGDEPSIELPWEYDYIGQPWQTQETVRAIQNQIWTDSPSGLGDGNDDLGAMSAWFVWSALGLYPMTPGTSTLDLGSPMFTQAVITLPSGNTLTIDGNGAADNAPYVQSASWNGSAWTGAYAPASAITSGGTLSFTLGTTADTSWASAAADAPPSYPGSTSAPPKPRVGPVTSGVSASLCLNDRQSETANGTPVQVYSCNGTDAQDWTIAPDGTVRGLGECLAVQDGSKKLKAAVVLNRCTGSTSQQWR